MKYYIHTEGSILVYEIPFCCQSPRVSAVGYHRQPGDRDVATPNIDALARPAVRRFRQRLLGDAALRSSGVG